MRGAAAAKSDAHPDVVAYRRKLQSVANVTNEAFARLDEKINETMRAVRTPVPPAPEEEQPTRRDIKVLAEPAEFPSRPPRP